MKRRALLVAMATATAACGDSTATVVGDSGHDVAGAVWVLDIEDCDNRPGRRATGFVVDTGDGPVLISVAHAVEDARSIAAVGPDGESIPLVVHHLDSDLDVGVYSAPAAAALPLDPPARPEVAEVWVRRNAGDDASSVAADVLRWVDVEFDGTGKRLGLELGRPADGEDDGDLIRSGDSGAPVIDPATSNVVGMVFATARTGDRGWATAATVLEGVLAAASLDDAVDLVCD